MFYFIKTLFFLLSLSLAYSPNGLASDNFQTSKSSLSDAPPAVSYTYVKEYASYSVSFLEKPEKHVLAIDLSSCHLLVIRNLEKDINGNSFISYFSLSHLPSSLLKDHSSLKRGLENILNEFRRVGGNLNSAEFLIYGGIYQQPDRETTREFLRKSLLLEISEAILTSNETDQEQGSNEESKEEIEEKKLNIKEPEGHWQSCPRGSRRYLFTRTLLNPLWVEENMDYEPDIMVDNLEYSSHDKFDERLKTKQEKVNFLKMINDSYNEVSIVLDEQTRNLQRNLQISIDLTNNPIQKQTLRVVRIANEDGTFRPDFCALCFKTCKLSCANCKKVYYCSKEHQKTHWQTHKINCSQLKKHIRDTK